MPHLLFLPDNFEYSFWPVLLILVGILVIAKRTTFHNHFHNQQKSELKNEAGFIDIKNIFSGGKQKVPPTEFKGGKISNIFGGTELDLTQATLAPGTNVLEIECIFGGVSLIVPTDWVITIQVNAVMGGFADKRTIIKNTNETSNSELIIKGSAIFGGGDVKSY